LLILDTDIASAFAKAGHFDVLIKLFGKVGITPMVYEELQIPLMHGYTYPDEIFNNAKEFGVNVITTGAIFKGFLIKGIATKKEVLKIIQDIETSDNRLLEIDL
jgi:hypothetical protein